MIFTRALLVTAVALSPSFASAQPRGEVLLLGAGDAKTVQNWEISRQKWEGQPKWSPSSTGSPPLPIAIAVELGETWLRKRHTDVKQFAIVLATHAI